MEGRKLRSEGASVLSERPASSGRSSAIQGDARSGPDDAPDDLTRAQTRALLRCAPLKPAEFRARGRVAEHGLLPLRRVLDERADRESERR